MLLTRAVARVLPRGYINRFISEVVDVVEKLPIAEAGISNDGIPYVQLENGTILYDHPPEAYLRYVYRLLTPLWYRKKVPEGAFGAAWDAWGRYWGKGIMDQQRYYQLRPGDIAVEAGAYVGHYVIKMAQAVGAKGRVVACEPDADNLAILHKNIAANDAQNVTVVPLGVWNSKGKVEFYKTTRQKNSIVLEVLRASSAEKTVIQADTIDSVIEALGLGRADFVVLTVNGAEIEALEGMRNTLAQGCHLAIAARYKRGGQPTYKTVVRMLEDSSYAVRLDHEGYFRNHDPKTQAVVHAFPRASDVGA